MVCWVHSQSIENGYFFLDFLYRWKSLFKNEETSTLIRKFPLKSIRNEYSNSQLYENKKNIRRQFSVSVSTFPLI